MRNLSVYLAAILVIILAGTSCSKKPITEAEKPVRIQDQINPFAVDMFVALPQNNDNVFFSPYSIINALGMTYAGAAGQTQQAMGKTLHIQGDPAAFHTEIASFNRNLASVSMDSCRIMVANAIYAQEDFRFLEKYMGFVKSNYDAGIRNVNFRNEGQRESTRKEINRWVEDNTNRKITELIPSGVLSSDTRMVLLNAVYFLGKWKTSFDPEITREGMFFRDAQRSTRANFMNTRGEYLYYEDKDVQVIDIPYAGGEISMMVVLPIQRTGIAEIGPQLKSGKLEQWTEGLRPETLSLRFPKFKSAGEFELSNLLSGLGMKVAFTGDADFSGMTGSRNLSIDAVLHKAIVEVDEAGTEAAAATAVIMMETSSNVNAREIIFNADHPFLFVIRHRKSGAILFMGKLMNPGGSESH